MEIEKLIRPHLKNLQAYSSARDEFTGVASVYLDANENALGSMANGDFNRYPDPHHALLKTKWSALKNIPTNQIFFGNGSDEPIDLLMRLFCEPNQDQIIIMPPTYGMYGVSAAINNVEIVQVPLTKLFEIDRKKLFSSWNEHSKLLFICSPNNPTGNALNVKSIEEIIYSFPGMVVIDEAYIDFSNNTSWIERLNDFNNLIVLQTLSKAWGMAAVRVGVAMASSFVIDMLDRIKPPYNISLPNQKLALEALDNLELQKRHITIINAERDILRSALDAMDIVQTVHLSDANFLLVEFSEVKDIFHYLTENGVIVRDRSSQLHCDNCLRITIGTKEENEKLISLLADY